MYSKAVLVRTNYIGESSERCIRSIAKCFTEIHTKLDKNQAILIAAMTRMSVVYVLLWCSSGVPSLTNEWRQRVIKVFQISRAIRDLK